MVRERESKRKMEMERNDEKKVVNEEMDTTEKVAATETEVETANKNLVYIRINKKLCTTQESKIEGRSKYNIMTLPKGTVVGEKDLSFGKINPVVMIEDKFGKNMCAAVYDKDKMKDNNVSVFIQENGQGKYISIDVDALRDAVAKANHDYYEEHKNTKNVEQETDTPKEKDVEKSVEQEAGKMPPLTTADVKKDQEVEMDS